VLRATRRTRPRVAAALLTTPLLALLGPAGCSSSAPPAASPLATAGSPTSGAAGGSASGSALDRAGDRATAPQQLDTERRVLVVSVDGLRSSVVAELGADDLPVLARLRTEGAGTLEARTAVEQTETLPNHTGMVTGRRIDADQGGHGVTWNTDEPGTTVQQAAGEPVGSLFSRVHAAGGSTALFTGKAKLSLFQRSWPAGLDRYTLRVDGDRLVELARRDLRREARTVTFLHLAAPDVAGHAHGWASPEYADAVRAVDGWLGDLLDTVASKLVLREHVTLVLTADHGGSGLGHVDPTRPEDYRIPFLTWGTGVAEGADLYELNDDYRDPGSRRPGYAAARQPVRNADVANLALDLLGLGAVPGSTVGTAQQLDLE
jgi:hypothetical protein